MKCLDYRPNGLLALPPNNVPLTDEFNVFPKVKDDVVAGAGVGSATDVAKVPEKNMRIYIIT